MSGWYLKVQTKGGAEITIAGEKERLLEFCKTYTIKRDLNKTGFAEFMTVSINIPVSEVESLELRKELCSE
jgi:hypothetical protein